MKRLLFFLLLCFSSVFTYAQKSLIEQEKPKPVSVITYQRKTARFLSEAGNGLVGGVFLSVLGTIISSAGGGPGSTSRATGVVLQIAGGASMVYAGVSLVNASRSYEKSLKDQSLADKAGKK